MQRFTELKVWQRAHALVLEIYRISASFPQDERFGVTSQLRRAVTSVPTNIAEGSRRQGRQEYSRFLNIAQGSAAEAEYLLILSRDLGYLSPSAFDRLSADLDEVARMLRTTVEGRWSLNRERRSASTRTLDSRLSTLDSRQRRPDRREPACRIPEEHRVLLIHCPWCGPRDEIEFHYGGQAGVAYPKDPESTDDSVWTEFLYVRDNPKGPFAERWMHRAGCRRWFNVVRDTLSHEFLPGGS